MPQETIEGVIENVIFHNPDTGYTVLSVSPQSDSYNGDSVVVVGKLLELHPGETVRFTGTWTTHREYGDQFKAEAMHLVASAATATMRYLTSGQIAGITDLNAKRIIDHFGDKALEILDDDPEKIHDVPGIKPVIARKIAASWAEQRKSRKVLMFLQSYGITAGLAHQIYEAYGDKTIEQIQTDPYRLTVDIPSVDFKTADQIAQNIGLSIEAPARLRAGVIHALNTLGNDGHIFAPKPMVIDKAAAILGVEPELCEKATKKALKDGDLVSFRKMPTASGPVEGLYTRAMYTCESYVAKRLAAMTKETDSRLSKAQTIDWAAFFKKLGRKHQVTLTEQQQDAVRAALTHKVCVLTGGPGTGKTTTLRAVIGALDSIRARYALASPTGRAAKRLSEATEKDAYTIHRLLGYSADGEWLAGEEAPLNADMIIIDETSMVDLELFQRLLAAVPPNAHLMLVGDVDQLPSVGAGDVLRDVINSGVAHVTRLDAIFRQASDSMIIVNAHKVNKGELPDLSNTSRDFFMFNVGEGEQGTVADLLVDVVKNRIPRKFGLDPLNDVQVLAPMYRGEVGIHALNERLQLVLNPSGEPCQIGAKSFCIGDKVIQTRNNYEKDVYNGDIGRVIDIDQIGQEVEIDFDGRIVKYKWSETYDLFHAFAISIHRSQGGEYPAAVIPVVPEHARMLQRNLLYTAITRAKQLVVLVGTRRAVQMAVENDQVARRYSGLVWQLNKLLKEDANKQGA